MKEKMAYLHKNNIWKLVNKTPRKKVIGCRWIFKKKSGIPSVESPRYKDREVAKGFSQVEGVDYHGMFLPVVKHYSIRLLLACVAMFDLEVEQLEVKIAFLHGSLEEVIYIQQPLGFIEKGNEIKYVYYSNLFMG